MVADPQEYDPQDSAEQFDEDRLNLDDSGAPSAEMRCWIARMLLHPASDGRISLSPSRSMWACASTSPGITVRPRSSTTFVA